MKYKTTGLEKLMFPGVHPEAMPQHSDFKNTWVPISEVIGGKSFCTYNGVGFIYFVNFKEATFHCFNNVSEALKHFDKSSCVWVRVSNHMCYRENSITKS